MAQTPQEITVGVKGSPEYQRLRAQRDLLAEGVRRQMRLLKLEQGALGRWLAAAESSESGERELVGLLRQVVGLFDEFDRMHGGSGYAEVHGLGAARQAILTALKLLGEDA
jgi:hypothetical protein